MDAVTNDLVVKLGPDRAEEIRQEYLANNEWQTPEDFAVGGASVWSLESEVLSFGDSSIGDSRVQVQYRARVWRDDLSDDTMNELYKAEKALSRGQSPEIVKHPASRALGA